MSELLEQAIVDAEALKEAALKNAEQAVIEKYSSEIKNAVETLLEQPMSQPEDMAAILGMGAAVEPAAAMGMMGGEGKRVLELAKAGLVANSGDSHKLAKNVLILKKMNFSKQREMGKSGREYAVKNFDKETLISDVLLRIPYKKT